MSHPPFRPLVIGSPRSGFVLLLSILTHLVPLRRSKLTPRQAAIDLAIQLFGGHVADQIIAVFRDIGLQDRLVFSPAFRTLTGGPKWLNADRPGEACFRKYVGVCGMGDFTLVTSHPVAALDSDPIVHSHDHPGRWLSAPDFAGYQRFASIRNPVDIVSSSLLSINALASEYLQKFKGDQPVETIRSQLAAYKYTDLRFFKGVAGHYRSFFNEFLPLADQFHRMKWENLIARPVPTIQDIAAAVGVPVDDDHAAQIWAAMSQENLTQWHLHHFRRSGGRLNDWMNWMTNDHLDILREMGLDEVGQALGYPALPVLGEERYTPFQSDVARHLRAGTVAAKLEDEVLFGFAFNKSNIQAAEFGFSSYDWKDATRVERSAFSDESVVMRVWEAADRATVRVNAIIAALARGDWSDADAGLETIRAATAAGADLGQIMPQAFGSWSGQVPSLVQACFAQQEQGLSVLGALKRPPQLLRAAGNCNVVAIGGRYVAVPQSLGPIDLAQQDVSALPGVMVSDDFAQLMTRLSSQMQGRQQCLRAWLRNRLRRWLRPVVDKMKPHRNKSSREIVSAATATQALFLIENALATGIGSIHFRQDGELARAGLAMIQERFPQVKAFVGAVADLPPVDFHVHWCEPSSVKGCELHDLVERTGTLLIPEHMVRPMPVTLISIPKAGTHLVMRMLGVLGYGFGGTSPHNPKPGQWYYLEFSNGHTRATDFFIDTVRRSPFGNRAHPFARMAAIFNYRNPFDILVSEAKYYHRKGKTIFGPYLAHLDYESRVKRLADDPWLMGSLRDRIAPFAAWLDFPNVIPVSFEELIGANGGGDDEIRADLMWSLQLKLFAPGRTDILAKSIFDSASPTFSEGKAGMHATLPPDILNHLAKLPQDFVEVFGYQGLAGGGMASRRVMSARREEFRNRPLVVDPEDFSGTPILFEEGFLGCNLVLYANTFYAIPLSAGYLDLGAIDATRLSDFLHDADLNSLKSAMYLDFCKNNAH